MGTKDENLDDDLDMKGLSDEERAALEDDDDESEILKNIVGEDDDDNDGKNSEGAATSGDDHDDGDAGVGDNDAAEAVAAAAASDSKPDNADDNSNDGVADDAPAQVSAEFQPEFRAQLPEGLADKITALDTRTADLIEKLETGEIDLPDFMAQKSAIDNERLQLTLAQKQAEWAQSQNEDARAQRWKWEQERFFGQEKAGIYKDPIMMAALDASVKQLAADKAHASKPASFFLEEADRQIRHRFNIIGNTKAADDKAKETKHRRDPDFSKLPKTLANLPAADIAETGSDEFAYLDKLEGIALEQALRKLTPEQEARYLGISA